MCLPRPRKAYRFVFAATGLGVSDALQSGGFRLVLRERWCKKIIKCRIPAVLEVTAGEYGNEFVESMVSLVENGKCYSWDPDPSRRTTEIREFQYNGVEEVLIQSKHLRTNLTGWQQFSILYKRRATQMLRDAVCLHFLSVLE